MIIFDSPLFACLLHLLAWFAVVFDLHLPNYLAFRNHYLFPNSLEEEAEIAIGSFGYKRTDRKRSN